MWHRKGGVFDLEIMNPVRRNAVACQYRGMGMPIPTDLIAGGRLYQRIVKRGKRTKIITIVREPISLNISRFFQWFGRYMGLRDEDAKFTIAELIDMFKTKHSHSHPLTWFDEEVKEVLGIDVYRYPFPKEKGHLTIKEGKFELLVLKAETTDSIKEQAIATFLDMPNFKLSIRSNVSAEKQYAATYREFKESIRLSHDYLDMMYNSKYARHFYSEREIDNAYAKWRKETPGESSDGC